KRGYRNAQGEAPLKETLAAALVYLTNWHPDRPFHDVFCGSGTIPIEAALMGQNIAPGFNRDFLCEEWEMFSNKIWDQVRMEAEDQANYDQPLQIIGSDIDHRMVDIAKANAFEAGLGDLIEFKQMSASDFSPKTDYGVLIGNPPYGERLSDQPAVEKLYKEMGTAYKKFDTWSYYILTSHPEFEQLFDRKA